MNLKMTLSGGLVLAALTTASAFATPVLVGHINFADSYGSTGGGEFQAWGQSDFTVLNPGRTGTAFQQAPTAPAVGHFETFCVEKYETLDFSITDYKADINTETTASAAAYADGAHGGFNDPLDARTAYLYTNFLNMTLASGYNYGSGAQRITDANDMQSAIWFIEQEITLTDIDPTTGNPYMDARALQFYNEANNAVNSGAWVGLGNVRILNIYTNTSRVDYQDVLIMTSSVPLPTGAAMAGLGLAGVGIVRRRRSR